MKYISYDYDGTLWEEDGSGPIEKVNAIMNFYESKGYKSVIITSRSERYLDEIRENYPDVPVFSAKDKGELIARLGNIVSHYDNNPSDIIDIALKCPTVETIFVDDGSCKCPKCATSRIRINTW